MSDSDSRWQYVPDGAYWECSKCRVLIRTNFPHSADQCAAFVEHLTSEIDSRTNMPTTPHRRRNQRSKS